MPWIGESLAARGLVPEAQVRRALEFQRSARCGLRLGSILLGFGALPERALLKALSDLHGVPGVPWSQLSSAAPEVFRMLPAEDAFRLDAMPYAAYQRVIGVAFVNPSIAAIEEVSRLTGRRVLAGVAPEVRILQAHSHFYGRRMDALRGSRNGRAMDTGPSTAEQDARAESGLSSQWLSEFAAEALDEFEKRSAALLRS